MAWTEFGKKVLFEGFAESLAWWNVCNEAGVALDMKQVGFKFKEELTQQIEPGEFGMDHTDESLPAEFTIPAGENVRYVTLTSPSTVIGESGDELAIFDLTDEGSVEEFPNGGTFIIDSIKFDLNQPEGTHTEPELPD